MSDYIKEKVEEIKKQIESYHRRQNIDCFPEERIGIETEEINYISHALQEMEERTREETLSNLVVGAIPETNEYANGWNDCRHAYGDAKKFLLSHKKDTEEICEFCGHYKWALHCSCNCHPSKKEDSDE